MNRRPQVSSIQDRAFSDVQLSKKLSWILRHGAAKEGLPIQANGFVSVDSILQHPKYASNYSMAKLERLVANDNKQRFMLRRNLDTGKYEIRANQGHSMQEVKSEHTLELIQSSLEIPMAVHGTYYRHWENIRKEGLRRMSRNHVHFATFDQLKESKLSNEASEISGFRGDCDILIYLDIAKVLADKQMNLYRSANGVVLCAGLGNTGTIPTTYFKKVINRHNGRKLDF